MAALEVQKLLQEVFILASGRGAGQPEMGFLESLIASGDYTALIDGVNYYMSALAAAQGNVATLKQVAMNGLNLALDDATATAIAEQLSSGQTTWANLFAFCIGLNDGIGLVLDNRAEAAQGFLTDLQTATKAELYAGEAVNQAVKNLIQGIDASSASLEAGKAGLDTLVNNLVAGGINSYVIDGYVKGATVFVDSNANNVLDAGEFSTVTGDDGSYQLPADVTGSKVIAFGGTDILTNKAFKGVLSAPAGSTTVSPLTTMLQAQVEAGESLAQAVAKFQQALDLPANVNLLTYDPLAVLASPAASETEKAAALHVQKAALQVANLITVATVALDAKSSTVSLLSAGDTVIAKLLAYLTSGQAINLGAASDLQAVIHSAALDMGLSATEAESLANSLGIIVANLNGKIAEATTLDRLAKVALVSQSTVVDAVEQALAAGQSLESIVPHFSGSALEELIDPVLLTSYVIDSPVGGLEVYLNGEYAGLTAADGSFAHHASDKVTFKVGKLTLAENLSIPADQKIYVHDLAGVSRTTSVVDDPKIQRIAQILQTLDADNNPDNGIAVDNTRLWSGMEPQSAETLTSGVGSLFNAGVSVVSPSSALDHLHNNAPFLIQADNVKPTASIEISDTALIQGEIVTVTIHLSEKLYVFGSNNTFPIDSIISTPNAHLSHLTTADGGLTYTGSLTPLIGVNGAAGQNNKIVLDLTKATDAWGNAGVRAESAAYSVDTNGFSANQVFAAVGAGQQVTSEGKTVTLDATGGYYRTMFEMAAASYWHPEDMKYLSAMEKTPDLNEESSKLQKASLEDLSQYINFGISAEELGLVPGQKYDEGRPGGRGDYAIDYKNGFYVGYNDNLLDTSSVALIGRSSDALFISFRGTDAAGDMLEDAGLWAVGMEQHYKRFEPLFNGIKNYLQTHPEISKVYVGGHSLGGEMATMFMQNHPDANGITYESVTFEPANKALGANLYDDRAVSFEMRADIVPDLGYFTNTLTHPAATGAHPNYGKTIYLDYEKDFINQSFKNVLEPHYMTSIDEQIDRVLLTLANPEDLKQNQRIFVDESDTLSGFVVADYSFWNDPINFDYRKTLHEVTFPITAAVIGALAGGLAGALIPIIGGSIIGEAHGSDLVLIGGSAVDIDPVKGATLGAVAGAVTGLVLQQALLEIADEDNAEYVKSIIDPVSGISDYQVSWRSNPGIDHTLVIRPFGNQANERYVLPENGVDNVIVANDALSLSENYDLNAYRAQSGVLLMGNDGNNLLEGSAHSDMLIGNGDEDTLLGGAGDDTLFGGDDAELPSLAASMMSDVHLAAMRGWIGSDFVDDVSYLRGGTGRDTIYCSGDNDYVLVEVDDRAHPGAVLDTVNSFNPDTGGASADYLIFALDQVGIDPSVLPDIADKCVFSVLGADVWDVEATNLQIGADYGPLDLNSTEDTFFIANDALWFDPNGSDGAGPFELVKLASVDGGIDAIDGSNILLVNSFNDFNFSQHAPMLAITDNVSGIASGKITYTFTFSQPVSDFTASDISVSNGVLSDFTSLSSTVYTSVVTPASNMSGFVNLSVAANVATDAHGKGNMAATAAEQAFDSVAAFGESISLGTYGNLIAPVQVEGKWYYYWDLSGDGSPLGVDSTTHDLLDGIFTQDINGNSNPGSDTNDTYRYATLNGIKLALPTANGGMEYPSGINSNQPVTSVHDGASNNPIYDDLLAIWDAHNDSATGIFVNAGVPSGWLHNAYSSATPSALGHASVDFHFGSVYDSYDDNSFFASYNVALQVVAVVGPVFSSPCTADVLENVPSGTTVYDATADGDNGISYSLSGVDSLLFNINASTGEVSFKQSPDYEAPLNQGGDNFYNFTVRASNAEGKTTDLGVSLKVGDVNENSLAGQAVIDLGGYGKLIAPVQVEGKWYYYWDRSGDGAAFNIGSLNGGVDYVTHDVLDGIFTQDINGNIGGGGNTTDTYRYATLNGVKLALPTMNGGMAYPNGIRAFQPGTAVQSGATNNPLYDELLAIWDAHNGAGTETSYTNGVTYIVGTPSGWPPYSYWSATGHAYVNLLGGGVFDDLGYTYIYAALQVV